MKELKEGDAVYVRRGSFLEAAQVDHTYVGCTGVDCVSFTSGVNAHRIDVMTYDEYWERQRAAAKALVIVEDKQ
jgi:hypothetical protein